MIEPLQGEREIPPLNRYSGAWKRTGLLFVGAVALVGFSAYAMLNKAPITDAETEYQAPELRASVLPPVNLVLPPEPVTVAAAEPVSVAPVVPVVPVAANPEPVTRVVYRNPPVPVIDKGLSRSTVAITGQAVQSAAVNPNMAATQAQAGLFGTDGQTSTMVAANNHGVQTVVASQLDNLDMIVPRGAVIGCALGTRLDSQLSGMTRCTVTTPVYSADGSRLLIPQGSTITGEYQSAVSQGVNRIGIIWDRLRTPKGVAVNIQSAAADQLGGVGVVGTVDSKFWPRFGGAILVSLIGDAVSAATNRDTTANVVVGNSAQAGSDIALEILRASIAIQPTIAVNHGARVNVLVSSDLSFAAVLP